MTLLALSPDPPFVPLAGHSLGHMPPPASPRGTPRRVSPAGHYRRWQCQPRPLPATPEPSALGPTRRHHVQPAKYVVQRGHTRGPLPTEPQRLGQLRVFPALPANGVQASGAAQHHAYRPGQNRWQRMPDTPGLPGILYPAQGIQQSATPFPNTILPHNRPPRSLILSPHHSTSHTAFPTINRPWVFRSYTLPGNSGLPEIHCRVKLSQTHPLDRN